MYAVILCLIQSPIYPGMALVVQCSYGVCYFLTDPHIKNNLFQLLFQVKEYGPHWFHHPFFHSQLHQCKERQVLQQSVGFVYCTKLCPILTV